MSTTPPSHTIHHIPPPGPTVLPLARRLCSPSSPSTSSPTNHSSPYAFPLPPYFTAAILIRQAVFVEEQHCDALEEVDADDARSWHWVLYYTTPPPPPLPPPPASRVDAGGGFTSPPPPTAAAAAAAATIRLVPVHGASGGDAHWDIKPGWGVPDYGNSEVWDGEEGYVKVGRLATVKGARGRGFGRVLVEECVRWARQNGREVGRGVCAAAGAAGHADEDAAAAAEGLSEEGRDGGGWRGLVGCHAQKYLEGWYGKLGFVRDRGMGEWEEDSIPHVGMWMRVEV